MNSPTRTTTDTITATGPAGTATDSVTVNVTSPISQQKALLLEGATVSRPDVMVEGTFTNSTGNETGITVNGIVALLSGNQFAVNHVPLVEGENSITAIATDIAGNTESSSVTVFADATGEYIRISADTASGVSPLEVTLTIDGSFDITSTGSFLSYIGPDGIELLSNTSIEYRIRLTNPGIYYFTADVEYENSTYSDTVAVQVIDAIELDSVLQNKWNSIKEALTSNQIDKAVDFFLDRSQATYRAQFDFLSDNGVLSDMVNSMGQFRLNEYDEYGAIYDLRTTKDGVEYSFQVLFVQDENGIWRIKNY